MPTIHQVAWIVPDLDTGVAQMQKVMGWGPWEVYDYASPRLHDLTVRGQPAEFTWTGAETEISPGSYVELLQPVSTSGIFYEWLMARRGDAPRGLWRVRASRRPTGCRRR